MFNIFKKKDTEKGNNHPSMMEVACLLIHSARIDENYTDNEEQIIIKTLIELGLEKEKISETITNAKILEKNSNQILDFTKEVKNKSVEEKKIVIEALWTIIYSDENADMYETNLMRRLSGLLYIDSKTMGDIKEQIKKENL